MSVELEGETNVMISRSSIFFAFASVFALAANVAACSETNPAPAQPLVKVPEVPNSVSVDALCDLAAQIKCAGATGCCGAKSPYGSVDECVAAQSTCSERLATVTSSALYADGTISYDGAAAAATLKTIAAATSNCETAQPAFDLDAVFVGSLGMGQDCSPKDKSGVSRLACANGLVCDVLDNDDGSVSGTCDVAVAPDVGNDEFTPETESTVEKLYCEATEMQPPSNNVIVPGALSINTDNSSNAGTTADVTLHFIQKSQTTEYYCTITGGIAKNTTAVCSSLSTRTWATASTIDQFFVEMNATDGLAVDSVAVCTSYENGSCTTNTSFKAGTFDGSGSMLNDRIEWAFGAFDDGFDTFWVDKDQNGDCTMGKVNFNDDNTVSCSTHKHN